MSESNLLKGARNFLASKRRDLSELIEDLEACLELRNNSKKTSIVSEEDSRNIVESSCSDINDIVDSDKLLKTYNCKSYDDIFTFKEGGIFLLETYLVLKSHLNLDCTNLEIESNLDLVSFNSRVNEFNELRTELEGKFESLENLDDSYVNSEYKSLAESFIELLRANSLFIKDSTLLVKTDAGDINYMSLFKKLNYAFELVNTKDSQGILKILDSKKLDEIKTCDIESKLPKVPELLYTKDDVNAVVSMISGVEFEETISNLLKGVSVKFYSSSHLSWGTMAVFEFHKERFPHLKHNEKISDTITLLMSGDVGQIVQNGRTNILGEIDIPNEKFTAAFLETTYGNREHSITKEEDKKDFLNYLKGDFEKILIAGFSNDRLHNLLFDIYSMINDGLLPSDYKVYIDGKLANKLHKHRLKNNPYIDSRFLNYANFIWITEPDFDFSQIQKQSDGTASLLLSTSGMMSGGSIMRHLETYLPYKKNLVLSSGYLAEGTNGRKIIDGEKTIKIAENTIEVKCSVGCLKSYSGHADRKDLVWFLKQLKLNQKFKLVSNHGDYEAVSSFINYVSEEKILPETASHVAAKLEEKNYIYERGGKKEEVA